MIQLVSLKWLQQQAKDLDNLDRRLKKAELLELLIEAGHADELKRRYNALSQDERKRMAVSVQRIDNARKAPKKEKTTQRYEAQPGVDLYDLRSALRKLQPRCHANTFDEQKCLERMARMRRNADADTQFYIDRYLVAENRERSDAAGEKTIVE